MPTLDECFLVVTWHKIVTFQWTRHLDMPSILTRAKADLSSNFLARKTMFYFPHTSSTSPQLIYFPFLILLFIFNLYPWPYIYRTSTPHRPYMDPTLTLPLTFFCHLHHHHHFFYCFPLPPPPPHFYCFLSTTATTIFLLFSLHYQHHHNSIVFFPPPPPPHFYCFPSTTTTFLLFSLHNHHHHISTVFPPPPPPPPHFYCFPSTTTTTTATTFWGKQ